CGRRGRAAGRPGAVGPGDRRRALRRTRHPSLGSRREEFGAFPLVRRRRNQRKRTELSTTGVRRAWYAAVGPVLPAAHRESRPLCDVRAPREPEDEERQNPPLKETPMSDLITTGTTVLAQNDHWDGPG